MPLSPATTYLGLVSVVLPLSQARVRADEAEIDIVDVGTQFTEFFSLSFRDKVGKSFHFQVTQSRGLLTNETYTLPVA